MTHPAPVRKIRSDAPFLTGMVVIAGMYLLLIVSMILADLQYTSLQDFAEALKSPSIRQSIVLTMLTCTLSAILSVMVAVPIGYIISRYKFPLKNLCDAILDIPIVLPPLVIGLSLLILFNRVNLFGHNLEEWTQMICTKLPWGGGLLESGITYQVPAIILAQFTVACAFAVRAMRNTFDQISPRHEQVALTLGCNRSQAFWHVVLPEAGRGVLTAGTLAWARALGEFGPILVFAGATRGKTEVLSTTVFLEISVGNLEGAVAVSLLMVLGAIAALIFVRSWDKGQQEFL